MEKKCGYCSGVARCGDGTIKQRKVDFGTLGEWTFSAEMAVFHDGPRLIVGLYGDECSIDFSEKISYCPFCGRKIRRDEADHAQDIPPRRGVEPGISEEERP